MDSVKVAKTYRELSLEEEIEKKNNKIIFFSYLKEEGLDVSVLLKNKKSTSLIEKYNVFISRMSVLFDFQLMDMMIFMDEEGFKLEETSKLLNFENSQKLKREIAKRFRLEKKIDTNDEVDFVS